MTTVHLEPNQVPSYLRGDYTGKTFRAEVRETMTIPADAGLWSGGSRETFRFVRLADGATINAVANNLAPWDTQRCAIPVTLKPGFAVVNHSYFCGKDMGLRFYVHPSDATKMLPAPVELTEHERIVLESTAKFKSSYGGKDRYDMARNEVYYNKEKLAAFPTRDQWATAKQSLIAKELLNKAGAITTKGRNAR